MSTTFRAAITASAFATNSSRAFSISIREIVIAHRFGQLVLLTHISAKEPSRPVIGTVEIWHVEMVTLNLGSLPPAFLSALEGEAWKRQAPFGPIVGQKVAAIVEVVVDSVDGGPVAACASEEVGEITGVHDPTYLDRRHSYLNGYDRRMIDSPESYEARSDNAERYLVECREKARDPSRRASYEAEADRQLALMMFNAWVARGHRHRNGDRQGIVNFVTGLFEKSPNGPGAFEQDQYRDEFQRLLKNFIKKID